MDVGTLLARLQLDTSEFEKGLRAAEGSASGFGAKLGPLLTAGALTAIAGVSTALAGLGGVAINAAGEASQGVRDLQAELGITEGAARQLGDEALEVFKNNLTGSITEAHEAIAEASRQLGEFVDPTQLGELATGALRVADVFGADYTQVLNSARTLMDRFGLDGQQALDFITKGFQSGLNNSGDFLDTVGEYSNLFAESKFTAAEFFSVMQTGLQGGILGTDKIADAFKEFNIRIREGTDEIWGADGVLQTSLGMSAEKVDELWQGMQDGSVSVADVYAEIAPLLASMENDVWRNTVGVQLFGTQWEDLGASALLGVDVSKTALEDMAGATDGLSVKYTSLADVGETLWRRLQVALIPVGDALLTLANAVMPHVLSAFSWLEERLPGWIEGAKSVISSMVSVVSGLFQGPLAGALGGAQSNFQTIGSVIGSVMAAAGAVVGSSLGVIQAFWDRNGAAILSVVRTAWNTIRSIIATVMQIIQAIVVPIWTAVAGFINRNQDTIVAYFTNAWNGISGLITGVLGFIQGLLKAVLAALQGDWTGAWRNIQEASASLVRGLWDLIKSAFENGKLVLTTITNAIKDKLAEVWGRAKDAVLTKAGEIWSGVTEKFDELKRNISGMGQEFLDSAKSIGSSIIDGIVNGVKGGIESVKNAAREAAQNALDAAKGLLGIQSPSKVAEAELGLPISQGWARGITRNRDLIAEAMRSVGQYALGAAAPATVAGTQVQNFYLTAQYSNYQSEGSLRDDVRMLQLLGAGV